MVGWRRSSLSAGWQSVPVCAVRGGLAQSELAGSTPGHPKLPNSGPQLLAGVWATWASSPQQETTDKTLGKQIVWNKNVVYALYRFLRQFLNLVIFDYIIDY